MRTASHQDISSAARKRPRPERNGMVYSETIVPHTPATSTVAGKKSSKTLPSTSQKDDPVTTRWNTCACQSTIQDRPPQIHPQTVWRIQLHCSVWAVPSGFCMSRVPSLGSNGEWRPGAVRGRRALIVRRPVLSSGARDPHHHSGRGCARVLPAGGSLRDKTTQPLREPPAASTLRHGK